MAFESGNGCVLVDVDGRPDRVGRDPGRGRVVGSGRLLARAGAVGSVHVELARRIRGMEELQHEAACFERRLGELPPGRAIHGCLGLVSHASNIP